MSLFKRPDRPTYKPHRVPPRVEVGDRVRIVGPNSGRPGDMGTVARVAGRSVVIELDRPYVAAGTPQRHFYSYAGELEVIPRVGKMGAVDLFADDEPDE